MKKIHFIAIGGRAMHSLAIALHKEGYIITGSDCEIFDPSKSHLEENGLMPEKLGWFPEKITNDIDILILGMHAQKDNPELCEAQRKGIKIMSYSEFIYEMSKDKYRVVIGGSYGKTTIATMIMHTLNFNGLECDYMIGAQIKGFESSVRLTKKAQIVLLEGDEYLSSVLDDTPKFLHFRPNLAILTGIAWEHANAFHTFEIYTGQFRKFIDSIEQDGILIYNENDPTVNSIIQNCREDIKKVPYSTHPYEVFESRNYLKIKGGRIPISIFGEHNMQNVSGAIAACQHLRFSEERFYQAIISYKNTGKRLELLDKNETVNIFLDKANSPSRLTATLKAVREQYTGKEIIACLELNIENGIILEYLHEYKGCLDLADIRMVYYDRQKLREDYNDDISPEEVKLAFGSDTLKVFTSPEDIFSELFVLVWKNKNLLLMSSGNFSGIDFPSLAKKILSLTD